MSEYITTALQEEEIRTAQEKLAELIRSDFARIDRMKADEEVTDFSKLDAITIGVMPGDGIGPLIMTQALRVLNQLLAPEIASGKVKIRIIEGMTFERRVELGESLPADVLAAWICLPLSAPSRSRRRTSTGASSARTSRASTSGATRAFRSTMTSPSTSRSRPDKAVSASPAPPLSTPVRTASTT